MRPEPLGTAAPTIARLRDFLQAPTTDAERFAAQRWLAQLLTPAGRRRLVPTTVWELSEGDELEDGHTVVEVRRNAAAGTVQVLTSEPVTTPDLPAEAPVSVVRR